MEEIREYTCKVCGNLTRENRKQWRKRPTRDKRICPICVSKRTIRRQTNKERSEYEGYDGYTINSIENIVPFYSVKDKDKTKN